jgi:hypothetical protein
MPVNGIDPQPPHAVQGIETDSIFSCIAVSKKTLQGRQINDELLA